MAALTCPAHEWHIEAWTATHSHLQARHLLQTIIISSPGTATAVGLEQVACSVSPDERVVRLE